MINSDNKSLTNYLNNSIKQHRLLQWTQRIIALFIVMTLLLNGCSSVSAIPYVDSHSSREMLTKIENQYQIWHNTPYRYGGNTIKGTDCSGLVMDFYKRQLNKSLPRTTKVQATYGQAVSSLQAGDLVFFKTGQGENGLHVGIYYQNGLFLHVSSQKGVGYASLKDHYWQERYWMARRIVS